MNDRNTTVIKGPKGTARFLPRGLTILHEDNDILVVNKPSGLLTMGTDTDKVRTAFFALTNYVRKGVAKSTKRIFIVHRLDRETSGILIFAKNQKAKLILQSRWQETEKKYLAIVHGQCKKQSDTISTYLVENKAYNVYSSSDPSKGRLAQTTYSVLREIKNFSLLEITLLTGRKHQIRVHLAGIGHPIVGDKKYGAGNDAWKYLALHAHSISFNHPLSGRPLAFQSEPPGHFRSLLGGLEWQE
jgi:tRNA pseudouridine32 synthase/23S rRNA pseudouridine746 synthase/23S rRNA pseudouridine1911/1915/1917 synthase